MAEKLNLFQILYMTEFSTHCKGFRTVTESRKYQCKKTSSCNLIQPLLTETSCYLNRKFSIFKPGSQSASKISKIASEKAKNLFYQNMFLQQKFLNSKKKHEERCKRKQSETQYQKLLKKLKEIRRTRLKREKYLDELIVQTKKLEKALHNNDDKYLTPKQPYKYVKIIFKKREESEKSLEQNESKDRRRKTVHTMIMRNHNSIRD